MGWGPKPEVHGFVGKVQTERVITFFFNKFKGIIGQVFCNVFTLSLGWHAVDDQRTIVVNPLTAFFGKGNKVVQTS